MTTGELDKAIRNDKGKDALDKMIADGMSSKQIKDLYKRISFYPNQETLDYIYAQENKKALDGFFAKYI